MILQKKICSFLWSYYGYPTSTYEGVNVEAMRCRNGEIMAQYDKQNGVAQDVDYVGGVPDSGIPHAIGYSNESGKKYARAFIKYTPTWARSFTPAKQTERNKVARMKQIPVHDFIVDKNLLFVDDSIVRGTTSLKIVKMLREAGASEVHVRIASAPLKYTCYYGVDVHTPEELISNKNSVEQVCKLIEADSLAFLSHEGMLAAGHRDDLCLACFNHKYPTSLYEE